MNENREHENPDVAFEGMTVNERLHNAGLLESWDRAARARDRQTMIDHLEKVGIGPSHAAQIVETTLANPAKYSF
jgi:hypothetical protein